MTDFYLNQWLDEWQDNQGEPGSFVLGTGEEDRSYPERQEPAPSDAPLSSDLPRPVTPISAGSDLQLSNQEHGYHQFAPNHQLPDQEYGYPRVGSNSTPKQLLTPPLTNSPWEVESEETFPSATALNFTSNSANNLPKGGTSTAGNSATAFSSLNGELGGVANFETDTASSASTHRSNGGRMGDPLPNLPALKSFEMGTLQSNAVRKSRVRAGRASKTRIRNSTTSRKMPSKTLTPPKNSTPPRTSKPPETSPKKPGPKGDKEYHPRTHLPAANFKESRSGYRGKSPITFAPTRADRLMQVHEHLGRRNEAQPGLGAFSGMRSGLQTSGQGQLLMSTMPRYPPAVVHHAFEYASILQSGQTQVYTHLQTQGLQRQLVEAPAYEGPGYMARHPVSQGPPMHHFQDVFKDIPIPGSLEELPALHDRTGIGTRQFPAYPWMTFKDLSQNPTG
jgi:hypothetical protein